MNQQNNIKNDNVKEQRVKRKFNFNNSEEFVFTNYLNGPQNYVESQQDKVCKYRIINEKTIIQI